MQSDRVKMAKVELSYSVVFYIFCNQVAGHCMLSGQGEWVGDGKVNFSCLYPCFSALVFAGTGGSLLKSAKKNSGQLYF